VSMYPCIFVIMCPLSVHPVCVYESRASINKQLQIVFYKVALPVQVNGLDNFL
jgi:hypothetical protein